ncbi:UDP-N-acetylglucosamine 2-epimerase [Marinobacter sp. EhC06]|jgi:UDP-N-acetylglucosamine 2-epimerase (non-hydrolysing)|uniref:non-hydrolyzing UDP-N-acetylglucosamine 2-epimerase n=1 Tax=Marinobacter TaxID=2742 RepID=UPI0007D99FEF|nr:MULTISPECIES: UDP-N-acetylglucosamine 2-epimerase (non-hydrolyzing) [unclassified Marinobacter]OAN92185.1 UDP-N-acetylglucosamine 2-epimerase [Marinobacter sp. EhN04]OAN96597.1 UDP-N-acetylglucosamine 2-epimerase [Marinobacter sp. EhC06]
MKRILTVFGTRPEAIKMAPVVKAIEASPYLESVVAVTAQHREMLDQVLGLFGITPDYDLNLMQPNQDLFDITARVLTGMRDVLRKARPAMVLVHGDTTTCFATGLAAFYEGIPVGHVEAGLRTGDIKAPFPEEANRTLVARITSRHFAPTGGAEKNLLAEGVKPERITVTGNTVIDALLEVQARLKDYDNEFWNQSLGSGLVTAIQNRKGPMVLITGHRRENFGQGFVDFCAAISNLSKRHADWLFVYPVHLNPNVQKPVKESLGRLENVILTSPTDYLPFVWLMDQCDLVLTDSGGIQEEAPSLGKPVVVTRDVTERPEAVEAGTVQLVGTSRPRIEETIETILLDASVYNRMSKAHNPYGDGRAARRIVEILIRENLT